MNTTKKLLLVSASTALSFLLIMGLNTAFSANPTKDPKDATALSPTFSGLTVKNLTTNEDVFRVEPTASGMVPSVQIGRATALDYIKFFASTVEMMSSLQIGDLGMNRNLTVFGDTDVKGNLKIKELEIKQNNAEVWSSEGKLVEMISPGSIIKSLSFGNLRILDLETTSSPTNATAINIRANDINMYSKDISMEGNLIIGNSVDKKDLEVSNNLTVNGTSTISDGLTVNGKITATNFGTITRYTDTTADINPGIVVVHNKACPAGTAVINCHAYGADGQWSAFENRGTYISGQNCYVWGRNAHALARKLTLQYSCWNPGT
jgi:hypothetical protein